MLSLLHPLPESKREFRDLFTNITYIYINAMKYICFFLPLIYFQSQAVSTLLGLYIFSKLIRICSFKMHLTNVSPHLSMYTKQIPISVIGGSFRYTRIHRWAVPYVPSSLHSVGKISSFYQTLHCLSAETNCIVLRIMPSCIYQKDHTLQELNFNIEKEIFRMPGIMFGNAFM